MLKRIFIMMVIFMAVSANALTMENLRVEDDGGGALRITSLDKEIASDMKDSPAFIIPRYDGKWGSGVFVGSYTFSVDMDRVKEQIQVMMDTIDKATDEKIVVLNYWLYQDEFSIRFAPEHYTDRAFNENILKRIIEKIDKSKFTNGPVFMTPKEEKEVDHKGI